MAKSLYIGIDLGTTGIKVGLFDEAGEQRAFAVREIQLDTPAPGFAEFDGKAYADAAFDGVREVLAVPGVDADTVRAIGFSSQAQTFVLLDEKGVLIRPAVGWLDVRAEAEAKELTEISKKSGNGTISAISSAPKLLWLRRNEPASINRTAQFLMLPDYLIWRLTGSSVCDPITASSTAAYDRETGKWKSEILEPCGLRVAQMPDVVPSGSPGGNLTRAMAKELGLSESVFAVLGTNDQYTAALGAGNYAPGCASLNMGTALVVVVTAEITEGLPPSVNFVLHPAHDPSRGSGKLVALLAFAKTAGIVLRWFRDGFTPSLSYEELFREAGQIPVGAEGLTCLPHFSGSATPEFNPAMRGAFAGLTLKHGRGHMARALVESLAFTVRENLDLVGGVVPVKELHAVGGGSKSDTWLQIIADATGVPVERPRQLEAACLGAAELAMAADGRFENVAEASRSLYVVDKRFEPDVSKRTAYDEAHERYRRLYKAVSDWV